MECQFNDIVDLVKVVIWPSILLWFLISFRKGISTMLGQLSKSVKKISVGNLFELELVQVEEAKLNWTIRELADARQPTTPANFISNADNLIQEIQSETTGDYAIIDLGTGNSWLSSRLFLFATLLKQTKGLENYVFLETSGGVQRRFIGIASAQSIRTAFGLHFTWFEESFMSAYNERELNAAIKTKPGVISIQEAGNMVAGFLRNIQKEKKLPDVEMNDWVPVGKEGYYEQASWINSNLLFDVLGDSLKKDCIIEDKAKSKEALSASIVMQQGKYVALVDNRNAFISLIDREKVLEGIGRNMMLKCGKDT